MGIVYMADAESIHLNTVACNGQDILGIQVDLAMAKGERGMCTETIAQASIPLMVRTGQ